MSLASRVSDLAVAVAAEVKNRVPLTSTGRDALETVHYSEFKPFYAALDTRETARVDVGMLGASITEGYPVATYGNNIEQRLAALLRQRFPTSAIGTSGGRGYVGVPSGTMQNAGLSPWTFSGGTNDDGSLHTGAKHNVWWTNTVGNKATLTLAAPITSFEIHHLLNPSGAAAGGYYKIDGGTAVTFNTLSSGGAYTSTVLTVTATAQSTIEIGLNAASYLFLGGIRENCWDESRGIQVHNLGHSGWTSAQWNQTTANGPWNLSLALLNLDLLVITDLGINDASTGGGNKTAAQFKADLVSLIAFIRAGGTTCPIALASLYDTTGNGSLTFVESWSKYVQAMREIAAADSTVVFFDHSLRMPNTSAGNTFGYYYTDKVHTSANGVGSAFMAAALRTLIAPRESEVGGPPVPPGGRTGQALVKASTSDYDAAWADLFAPIGSQKGLAAWNSRLANRENVACNVLMIGDSVTEGVGASGYFTRTVTRLQDMLRGLHPTSALRPGAGYIGVRQTYGQGPITTSGTPTDNWQSNVGGGLGNKSYGINSGDTLTWATQYCDRIRVWYTQQPSAGNATVLVDGVSVGTLTGAAGTWASGRWFDTGVLTQGQHVLSITGSSAADIQIEGAEFFNGDWGKGVHVFDSARSGAFAGDFVSSDADKAMWTAINQLQPDLTIVNLGINNVVLNDPPANYLASIDAILARLALANLGRPYSVLLVAPYTPSRTAQQNAYWVAYRQGLAARVGENVAFLDLNSEWPVLAADGSKSRGLHSETTDPLHPSDLGHEFIAATYARVLTAIDRMTPVLAPPDLTLTTEYFNSQPPIPAVGTTLFTRGRARNLPAVMGPLGVDTVLQPNIFGNKIARVAAIPSSAGPTIDGCQIILVSNGGTAATAVGLSASTFFGSLSRFQISSTTTAGTAGNLRTGGQWHRSATANKGGFHFVARFGLNTFATGYRCFVGLASNTNQYITTANPSSVLNQLGFGFDDTGTTLKFFAAGSAAATPIDLGASFTANAATTFFEVSLFCASGATNQVRWSARNLNTGVEVKGIVTLSTNLPAVDTLLAAHFHYSNAALTSSAQMHVQHLYVETDN